MRCRAFLTAFWLIALGSCLPTVHDAVAGTHYRALPIVPNHQAAAQLHLKDRLELEWLNDQLKASLRASFDDKNERVVNTEDFLDVLERVEYASRRLSLSFKDQESLREALGSWEWVNDGATRRFVLIVLEGAGANRNPYRVSKVWQDGRRRVIHMEAEVANFANVVRKGRIRIESPGADSFPVEPILSGTDEDALGEHELRRRVIPTPTRRWEMSDFVFPHLGDASRAEKRDPQFPWPWPTRPFPTRTAGDAAAAVQKRDLTESVEDSAETQKRAPQFPWPWPVRPFPTSRAVPRGLEMYGDAEGSRVEERSPQFPWPWPVRPFPTSRSVPPDAEGQYYGQEASKTEKRSPQFPWPWPIRPFPSGQAAPPVAEAEIDIEARWANVTRRWETPSGSTASLQKRGSAEEEDESAAVVATASSASFEKSFDGTVFEDGPAKLSCTACAAKGTVAMAFEATIADYAVDHARLEISVRNVGMDMGLEMEGRLDKSHADAQELWRLPPAFIEIPGVAVLDFETIFDLAWTVDDLGGDGKVSWGAGAEMANGKATLCLAGCESSSMGWQTSITKNHAPPTAFGDLSSRLSLDPTLTFSAAVSVLGLPPRAAAVVLAGPSFDGHLATVANVEGGVCGVADYKFGVQGDLRSKAGVRVLVGEDVVDLSGGAGGENDEKVIEGCFGIRRRELDG